jgi:hypothetical protein
VSLIAPASGIGIGGLLSNNNSYKARCEDEEVNVEPRDGPGLLE